MLLYFIFFMIRCLDIKNKSHKMKILKILTLTLLASQSLADTLPTYTVDIMESELSLYSRVINDDFSNKNKEDLLTVPKYIIDSYLNKKTFPSESDLNIIGSKYNIPNGLLYAMFWKESEYKCNKTSNKAAKGCFQFISLTAKKMGILSKNYDYRSHPWISADAAARYLLWNFKFLNLSNYEDPEQWKFAVAAYNAGPNKIKQDYGLTIPFYTETQYYVDDIIGYVTGDKYIVKPGDLIGHIAKNYKLNLATFRLLNGKVSNKNLQKGAFVTIKKPIKFYKYIVQPGDTLTHISDLTGVSIQMIGQTNSIRLLSDISKGQVLYLPLF
jgi:LysM repeat protein